MSIDSLYEGMIAKLTKQGKILAISKDLLLQKTNEERVLFVYGLINENNSFPKVPDIQKSQNVSIYYRNRGNEFFQKSEDFKAWQYYNLALLHAPLKSDQYPLALANRSAVFFSMEKFNECIKDIQTIFSMKYPGRLKEKLLKRQSLCEEALSSLDLNPDIPKSYDRKKKEYVTMQHANDPRYPCASSKLKVVNNDEMGRHVIAKEDINVGEVLVQEEPYTVLLQKSQYLFSCSYCLSRDLNLLPCQKCCFVMYCSEDCHKKALKAYHEIECPLMPMLINMEFTKLELLALRTAIRARTDHTDWASLFRTIEEAEANANTEYRGHIKLNGKWIFDSTHYTSIHTLASNIEKRSMSDIFQKAVTAAVFLKVLSEKTDFMKCENDEELENIRRCVAGILLLHVMTSPTNMHGLSSNMETKHGNYEDEISIASGSYAYHSLFNHSCCPNVVRFSSLGSGKITLFALRPIKKGQQLFDNYG